MIKPRLESIGLYTPEKKVSTKEIVAQLQKRPVFNLEQITGIKNRRFRAENEDSFSLAMNAIHDCLKRSKYKAEDLDIIICTAITHYKNYPHYQVEPAMSLMVKKELGAHSAIHFDISNACAGMTTGVYTLFNLIKAGMVKRGLIVSGECITPITETAVKEIKVPLDDQFASLTVGDSGSAIILDDQGSDEEGIDYVEHMTSSDHAKLCIGMPSMQNPGAALYTNNTEMHKTERVESWMLLFKKVLADQGKTFAEEKFDHVIHHQIGLKVINRFQKYAGKALKIKMPEPLNALEEFANTASTSHFLVLYEHLKRKQIGKGSKILLFPAASGIVTGCISITLGELGV